jgi:hypothetical protein
MEFWKRQRRIRNGAGNPNPVATNYLRATRESSSFGETENAPRAQRLTLESGFRRMSDQHDRARAAVLGSAPLKS